MKRPFRVASIHMAKNLEEKEEKDMYRVQKNLYKKGLTRREKETVERRVGSRE